MTMLAVYPGLDALPLPKSVPVSVLILAQDEAMNINQCLGSVQWADQIIVIDSGSRDKTKDLAREVGAEVVVTHWRGFGRQREFALRLASIRNDWVYFVDADEWISTDLAKEIAQNVENPQNDAYWQYFRLIFQGRWIRHCGWYRTGRVIRLMNRNHAHYEDQVFSEHPCIDGPVGRLRNDIVDDDHKGLAQWLRKHIVYAELETEKRLLDMSPKERPLHASSAQSYLKDRVAPRVPARAFIQFMYMYFARRGFLDGRQGLLFCFFHSWFQTVVQALVVETHVKSELSNAQTNSQHQQLAPKERSER
jgi:glycosyltransferase involved in cell wall biosynthesis